MSRILFLSMYSLENLDSAPKVRSYFLHKELDKLEGTYLIEGSRLERTFELLNWVIKGRLFKTEFIYVESSTSVGSPFELVFLILAKLTGKKIFIFIRDAYPLFPEEFPSKNIKDAVLNFGWKTSYLVYKTTAKKLLFPSASFAKLFNLSPNQVEILEPGGEVEDVEVVDTKETNKVGYVGGTSDRYGLGLLDKAMGSVRNELPNSECIVVVRGEDLAKVKNVYRNLVFKIGDRKKLKTLFNDVEVGVLPLSLSTYNKVSLPVKLFDYMALGKAIVSTDLPEVAKVIGEENIGFVAEDNPKDFAEKMKSLLEDKKLLKTFQENSLKAIRNKHSWYYRAKYLHSLFR